MRAIAIVFMVLCHCLIYLTPLNLQTPWLYFFSDNIVGDLAAPMFLFLVGVSQAVSAEREQRRGRNNQASRTIKRGGAIVIFGLFFAVVAWGPRDIFNWDILPLIGVSLIAIAVIRRWPSVVIAALAGTLVVAAPSVRGYWNYVQFWGGGVVSVAAVTAWFPHFLYSPVEDYQGGFGLAQALRGLVACGYFPILPWLAFPLCGYVTGRHYTRGEVSMGAVAIGGLLLMVLGLAAGYKASLKANFDVIKDFLTPLAFYPNTTTMLLLQLGFVLTTFAVLTKLCDQQPQKSINSSYCQRLSRYSLTVYVGHHFAFLWPLWLFGAINGQWDMYYKKALPNVVGLSIGVAVLILLQPLLALWDRKGGKYSLEWFLKQWC